MFNSWNRDPEAFSEDYAEYQDLLRELAEEKSEEEEEGLYPSFYANTGRRPIAGVDYNPHATMCQDDYEYFTGTGCYTDNPLKLEDDYDPRDDYEPDDGFYFEMDGE